MKIIGIDCATQPNKTGLALGEWDGESCTVLEVQKGSQTHLPVDVVRGWLDDQQTLLALDAPLGWPRAMGERLAEHQAGQLLGETSNHFFSRNTDRFVREKTGKRPLEVGAALIARTAHASLAFLEDLRCRSGRPIPLAWDPNVEEVRAIEVYPAATLISHGIPHEGYKGYKGLIVHQEILRELENSMVLPDECSHVEGNDDLLDAVICILAAVDFLEGNVHFPENPELAQKEGWIWFYSR